jgi:hypothetical protein
MNTIRFSETPWGDWKGLRERVYEGTIVEGDIIAMFKYDKSENRLPSDKYGLVIDSSPDKKEITVIRQFSNGDVAKSLYRITEDENLELHNIDHYEPGSENYNTWKRRLVELELWESKK